LWSFSIILIDCCKWKLALANFETNFLYILSCIPWNLFSSLASYIFSERVTSDLETLLYFYICHEVNPLLHTVAVLPSADLCFGNISVSSSIIVSMFTLSDGCGRASPQLANEQWFMQVKKFGNERQNAACIFAIDNAVGKV